MIRILTLAAGLSAALPCLAAPPTFGSFSTTAPIPAITLPPRKLKVPSTTNPPGYTAAPTPDQDNIGPQSRASNAPSVSPGFFSRTDQYRGEGISPSSSAQAEQDKRAKPGGGISLKMPLQ